MPTVEIGAFHIVVLEGSVPADYVHLRDRATFFDEYDLKSRESGSISTVIVNSETSRLVVAQHHSPDGSGFPLGLVVVPETGVLFIGAGERLLAYDLIQSHNLWEDNAEFGFRGFKRHGDVIVMSAELELAAWDLHGHKLWTTFVEPPWGYEVFESTIHLDVMGSLRHFNLRSGQPDGL